MSKKLLLSLVFVLCAAGISSAAGYEWNYSGGYTKYFQLTIDNGTTLNQTGGMIETGDQFGMMFAPLEWRNVPMNSQNNGPEWAWVEMPMTAPPMDSLWIGAYLPADTKAIYNMRGGELRCYGNAQVGVQGGSPGNNSLAQWNIYEGSTVNINIYHTRETWWGPRDSEWDWLDGIGNGLYRERLPDKTYPSSDPPHYNLPMMMMAHNPNLTIAGHGEVNIFGGDINVQGNVQGSYYGGDRGALNIYGSLANINFQGFYAYNLNVTFVPDSDGTSPIKSSNGSISSSPPFNVKVDGFLSLKVDSIDLLTMQSTSNWYSRALNLELDTTYWGTRLKMAGDTPEWNLLGVYEVFDEMNPLGKVAGSLNVYGTYTPILAIFKGLEGNTVNGESLASVLCKYLNDTVVETGMVFTLYNDRSLVITGDYLNDSGWAYFAWDLTDFNALYAAYTSGVTLYQLNEVPEPSTWALMLLGGGAMVGMRLRRRK